MFPVRLTCCSRRRPAAPFILFCSACLVGLSGGCGDGRQTVYPVKGKITVGGQPAGGAIIVLIPQEGSEEFLKMRPNAEADSEGNFEITSYVPGDGAPAGRYKAVINWISQGQVPAALGGADADDDEKRVGGGQDLLGGRYSDPDTSTIEITVEKGENAPQVIDLK